MENTKKQKVTGYDKYVDWKLFIIPVVIFALILIIPAPEGMRDVGTEYSIGPETVIGHVTQELFQTSMSDAQQWQLLTAKIMEQNMRMGAMSKARFLKRNTKWCKKYKIDADSKNIKKAVSYVKNNFSEQSYEIFMGKLLKLRRDILKYEDLSAKNKKKADQSTWKIKVDHVNNSV